MGKSWFCKYCNFHTIMVEYLHYFSIMGWTWSKQFKEACIYFQYNCIVSTYVTPTLHFASSTRVRHSDMGMDTLTLILGQKHVKCSEYFQVRHSDTYPPWTLLAESGYIGFDASSTSLDLLISFTKSRNIESDRFPKCLSGYSSMSRLFTDVSSHKYYNLTGLYSYFSVFCF